MLLKNNIDTPVKSYSVPNIMALLPTNQQKSYSTTYRHIKDMQSREYIQSGLDDGAASTYYITDSGKLFYQSQTN